MRASPSSSRLLFFVVLAAIVAVFFVGRYWMRRGARAPATEAGIVPGAAEPAPK
jgi:hypothetical protein